jgi:mitotic spindle assembly checkpoint protein MAD1
LASQQIAMSSTNLTTRKRGLLEASAIIEPASRRIRRDVTSSEYETIKAELEHERSLRALDEKRFKQSQQRLERQVEFAVEDAKEAKRLLEEVREESDRHIEQLRQARKEALMDLRDVQLQLEEERAVAAAEATEEDPKLVMLETELEAKSVEHSNLLSQLSKLRRELERSIEKPNDDDLPSPDDGDASPGKSSPAPPAVLRELNKVRIRLAESERKNRQLLRAAEDFQEKKKELVHERERAISASDRAQRLEEEMGNLSKAFEAVTADMNSWKEFGSSLITMLTNSDLRLADQSRPPEIATLRRYMDKSQIRVEQLQTHLDASKKELESAKIRIAALEATGREHQLKESCLTQEAKDRENRLNLANQQVQMMESQERIWKREIESLRSLVEMFDKLPLSVPPADANSSNEVATTSQASFRVLQASWASSRAEVEVLREEQQRLQKSLEKVLSEKDDLEKQMTTVKQKFAMIKEAILAERAKAEKAEERAIYAETLAGKGSFNPDETRVLHLKHNPLTQALKEEIGVLRRQVEALTGEKSRTTESSELDPNKLHQRLKESFKEQISRFREGVYLMTGFKIDMIPGNDRPTFRVRSLFAEHEQDHLMFQWPEGEKASSLDLMATDFAKSLATTPSYDYIAKLNSLPAFLASTQLSLFEKQTMMQ